MTTITGQRSLINIAKEKIAYSISKGGNQKPKIEEGQTIQCSKEKVQKDKQ
jgi:hypothetical protein